MPLNDHDLDEYAPYLESESLYPRPGVEIGGDVGEVMEPGIDRGSGSFAEDGRLEVAEDAVMMDGEDTLLGSAAMFGPSEIGGAAEDGQSEIGAAAAADRLASEIGAAAAADREAAEIGARAMFGPTPIARASSVAPFESFMLDEMSIGAAAAADRDGSEIGAADRGYGSEIGAAAAADREGSEIGSAAMYGPSEIGVAGAALMKVVEKARDNRQPAPPMQAVDIDAPMPDDDDGGLTETCIGAAEASGNPDPFPLLSQLLLRAGAGMEPRLVRVDTEESYKAFRAEHSPEMAELSEKVDEVSRRLDAHMHDPEAHSALADDIEDLTAMGAEVQASEDEKRVDLWMPKRFDGLVSAWREGDFVCASMVLPGMDGEVRICTSLEPVRRCVAEMSRHAAEAGVPASTVVGVLPAMGCVLGAGTLLKEMAVAAPSILQRPEAAHKGPFMVRIEPKTNPAITALMMLAYMCRDGNQQACTEWQNLGALSPPAVKQAMMEALQLVKAA